MSRSGKALALFTVLGAGCLSTEESSAPTRLEGETEQSLRSVKDAAAQYLNKRFFHLEGGQTYTSFIPIPAGQSTFQNNWRKQARNHPHESLVVVALAQLGRCAEAKSVLLTFFQQQSAEGGYRYDTRYDRGPWDNRSYAAAPLLAFESWEVYRYCGGDDFLRTAYGSLTRNKAWWDDRSQRRFPDEAGKACNGLWHWADVIESIRDSLPEAGHPTVPTWAASEGPRNQCAADLNFYLLATYRALAKMEAKLGANDHFEQQAQNLAAALREQFWDEPSGFFYGVDRRNGQRVLVRDIGGWMALFSGAATPAQAERMVQLHLRPTSGAFHTSFGLPALDRFHPAFGSNAHWSGGAWPGLSLLVVRGLVDYGYVAEAQRIARPFADALVAGVTSGTPLPEWYDSQRGNVGGLFCEVNDERSPDNAKVNCDYLTASLGLPMAVYAGLPLSNTTGSDWSCARSAYRGQQYWTCSQGALYRCERGVVQKTVCAAGCLGQPVGTDDVCKP